jgi:hypothetical protein
MKRSLPKRTMQVLAASSLVALFLVNILIVHDNDLWWQWVFGVVLSIAGGLLVAIAIASLMRRHVATQANDEEDDDPAESQEYEDEPGRPVRSKVAKAFRLRDTIESLPGVGRENARVARTFGVSTLGDFAGLDAASQESLRTALGSSLFDRVSSIVARASEAAGR